MKIYKIFIAFVVFVTKINSCPTKFANELFKQGKLSLYDVSNLESHSLSTKSTNTTT